MDLETIFEQTSFLPDSRPIHDILSQISLLDFSRTREGKKQTFHFTFSYQGSSYIMHHSFIFKWTEISHSFRFSSPFFSLPPFQLPDNKLVLISDEFMRSVNQWTRANQ
ncbi:hypothetical protein CN918_31860 [Priestia megaterium]|nr:hypothetical protein CN918_31860 [Priestia megaterium]